MRVKEIVDIMNAIRGLWAPGLVALLFICVFTFEKQIRKRLLHFRARVERQDDRDLSRAR